MLSFGLDNAGFADARVVNATAIASGAPVVVHFPNPAPQFAPQDTWVPIPAGGMDLTPAASDHGMIRLAPGLCRDGGGHPAEVRGLELQGETLGMPRTQRFMRDVPVTLHCPADRPG